MAADPLAPFGETARGWFRSALGAPTRVQAEGWARIAAGEHALLAAPTGSGKTLAAFFYFLDRLGSEPRGPGPGRGVRLLYLSPQKALAYDIERNLRAPLAGIARAAAARGARFEAPRVALRTGDTPAAERRAQGRDPAEILVTTPESLYLILGSRQRETLRAVEAVIVDEIHALAANKRGAHLALSLERLAAQAERDPQRIGLSATARPLAEVARFLGGDRAVAVVDAGEPPRLSLEISVPVPDLGRPAAEAPGAAPRARTGASAPGLWPALHPVLLEAVRSHRSSILFANSRGLCERLAQRLNELAGEPLLRAHHGSLAREKRREIEEALKSGALRGIVATSSLELGIDMPSVDLVLLVESPGSVARGLQRVGRAGHQVGGTSRARIFPKHRGDLLEAVVVADGMRAGAVEALAIPRNPLDVLAQQIVAAAALESWELPALERMLRRAAPFRELSRELLVSVLDLLAGRYPSTEFAELRPRIVWDRVADRISGRPGARQLALVSGGTIPDRGHYGVHLGQGGPRIGELDEEMVHETRVGERIALGASSWRVDAITRDRVLVSPAPGEPGKLPFWRGDGPGRPVELGRALGAYSRALLARCDGPEGGGRARAEAERWLRETRGLDAFAARNLVDWLLEQRLATGVVPTDRSLCVERFRDELGDWRVCIHSPFGAPLHAPWALAIEAGLGAQRAAGAASLWTDDGIALRFADADELPPLAALLPDPEQVEERVVAGLAESALLAGTFRECAARALLLPRRGLGRRTPLWTQRLRSQQLLAVAQRFPEFPILLEAYRECLRDVFDLPGLVELLRGIRAGEIAVHEVETPRPSPYARALAFEYTAAYLYQGDLPAAERRAQTLALDRELLRELLGHEDLRSLLDPREIASLEAELQGVAEERRAGSAGALHDLLRRVGDLGADEIAARSREDPAPWLAELADSGRAVRLAIAGEERYVAAEDAALYRDALGVALPASLPAALRESRPDALGELVLRFARSRAPFPREQLERRFGLPPERAQALLERLAAAERLVAGEFRPGGAGREWCDPEVLRRIKRRTLARLRAEVEPVDAACYARFLLRRHGIGEPRRGAERLAEVLEQLEGMPFPLAELEGALLPARVAGYEPRQLDELLAQGAFGWLGSRAAGEREGRIALLRREGLGPAAPGAEELQDLSELEQALLQQLAQRGASFFSELAAAAAGAPERERLDALLALAWRGLVSNDSLAPLRARALRRPPVAARRPRRAAGPSPYGGRWTRLADPTRALNPTLRLERQARAMLARWGVLSRAAADAEAQPGGFAALLPLLRELEQHGSLRRGHFVEGLAGAQFAEAGTVDRLRAERERGERGHAVALAAADPAQPYGALLPWPESAAGARPRRASGCSVVLVDGEPLLFAERGALRLASFRRLWQDARCVEPALRALAGLAARAPRGGLRIEEIDAAPAQRSPLAPALLRAGFRVDYKGLVLERPTPVPGPRPIARPAQSE